MLREFVTQSTSDTTAFAILVMLTALAAFASAVYWVMRKEQRMTYEVAARLPLDEANHD